MYGRVSRKATGPREADALTRNPHGKLTDSNNKKIIIKNNSSKAFIQILAFAWEIKLPRTELSYRLLLHSRRYRHEAYIRSKNLHETVFTVYFFSLFSFLCQKALLGRNKVYRLIILYATNNFKKFQLSPKRVLLFSIIKIFLSQMYSNKKFEF